MCGARIPAPLAAKLEALGHDDAAVAEFGIEYATRQCEELLRAGVPGIHFYTLNKAHGHRPHTEEPGAGAVNVECLPHVGVNESQPRLWPGLFAG